MDPALPLLAKSDRELGRIDPIVQNLLVAKGLPSLADLDVDRFAGTVDGWVREFRKILSAKEANFDRAPQDFKNDIRFYRLVALHWYFDERLGIRYKEDQRDLKEVFYTDPSDLFVNGVIDTRRGTCGNMAALYVAMCWRLGWPVSLACINAHTLARFEDGGVVHNIEVTTAGMGGCGSRPDDYYCEQHSLPPSAMRSGSDLRSLTPRESLGVYFGHRGRHHADCDRWDQSEADYLLARYLLPKNRKLYLNGLGLTINRGKSLFDPGERGHPTTLAQHVRDTYGWNQITRVSPLPGLCDPVVAGLNELPPVVVAGYGPVDVRRT